MGQLDNLIKRCENDDNATKNVKRPKLFITSLKELRDLIGNDNIKDNVALQITHLISNENSNQHNPPMINTLLYGPPGTGKTSISLKLAKIWYAIGYINNKEEKISIVDMITSNLDNLEKMSSAVVQGAFILTLIIKYLLLIIRSTVGRKYTSIFFVYLLILLVFLFCIYYINKNNEDLNNDTIKDTDLITTVSREDFIDKYLGGTDKKTKALLQQNTGKVLFIDEAYSLYTGEHDIYGIEALTTINRYMSEHPTKIFIIMAGYRDKLKNGVFTVQPGLISRFMWQFECNQYTPSELFSIFVYMIEKEQWYINKKDTKEIKKLFGDNYYCFKAAARDVQRLFFFCKLEHCKSINSGKNVKSKSVTSKILSKSIKQLNDNNEMSSYSTPKTYIENSSSDYGLHFDSLFNNLKDKLDKTLQTQN